jgi:hypothetical protein
MSVYRLDRLLSPHALAVVGASPREASVGRHVVANIRAAGFPGAVHVVNPNYAAIEGIDTVKSLDAITGPIDVAVIAVPPAAVPETVAAAGAKGALRRPSRPNAAARAPRPGERATCVQPPNRLFALVAAQADRSIKLS